nr:hypothetical protein GCM10020185_26430 [Pseudomonas brassicacearum subsp. brassicacearum]
MVDRTGVIHSGRDDLNQYKAVFAHTTEKRSLADALDGADVFVGLSGPNLLSAEKPAAHGAEPNRVRLLEPGSGNRPGTGSRNS